MSKGQVFEKSVTHTLHQKYCPVLVSSQLLRSYNCGQIDVAYWHQGVLYICEVKCSGTVSAKQKVRLYRSANFISKLLGVTVKIQLVKKTLPNGLRFFNLIL